MAVGAGPRASTTTHTTARASTTLASTTTTARPSTTTTRPLEPVPPQVTFITAGKSGGSGEIEVNWEAVPGGTGYRVYRSTAPGGPFSVAADWNLSTGSITKVQGMTNVWSPPANIYPFTTQPGVAPPEHFQYVEFEGVPGGVDRRYFKVTAYNTAGEGPASIVECGAALGAPQC